MTSYNTTMSRRNQQMPRWVALIFAFLGAYIILLSLGVYPTPHPLAEEQFLLAQSIGKFLQSASHSFVQVLRLRSANSSTGY